MAPVRSWCLSRPYLTSQTERQPLSIMSSTAIVETVVQVCAMARFRECIFLSPLDMRRKSEASLLQVNFLGREYIGHRSCLKVMDCFNCSHKVSDTRQAVHFRSTSSHLENLCGCKEVF